MERTSLNKVIIVGRVGNKPEGRYTPSGTSTASFSVATNEVWGEGDNRQEHTEWHNIVAWNRIADFVTQYVQKGQLVCIEGRLRTRSWTDKDENVRKVTEIICSSITPLIWKTEGSTSDQASEDNADSAEEELPF